jgi:glycosyltransferase involved in cell wall biosynthesis
MNILFVYNVDWFFKSHRFAFAKKLQIQGHKISLVSNSEDNSIESFLYLNNINFFKINLSRGFKNIYKDVSSFFKLIVKIKRINPDLIEFATIKPILIGGLICKFFLTNQKAVFWLTGLGHIFIGDFKKKLSFKIVTFFYKIIFNNKNVKIVFENKHDQILFKKLSILKLNNSYVLPGSFVNPNDFEIIIEPKEVSVTYIGRIQEDKGISYLIDAIKILRNKNINNKFFLAGKIDDNPTSFSLNDVKSWEDNGLIEYLGFVKNPKELYYKTNIICLPSKREGLPKVIVEAGACSRPSIVTNVPGCKDIITNNFNGLIVNPDSPESLANAIEKLILDKKLRLTLGYNARINVENKYSFEKLSNSLENIYFN